MSADDPAPARRRIGIDRMAPDREAAAPASAAKLSFREYVARSRPNVKTRRGVLLICAKADDTRVPFFRIDDETHEPVWPETWEEMRANLRAAEPLALNEIDKFAMWTPTDIVRVGRDVWEDYEREALKPFESETARARRREQERRDFYTRRERLRKERRAAKSPVIADWIEIGVDKLDELRPLHELTRTESYLERYGSDTLARRDQITAGQFLWEYLGRTDMPLKGGGNLAAKALDRMPGWYRAGKKRHMGSVSVVWRRDGATSEFTLASKLKRRKVL